jgi:hypothetical protein
MRVIIPLLVLCGSVGFAWGQQGSLRSGEDPFQLNWSTGRFDYVPVPRDPSSGPYQYNSYSGRWDYVPVPAPQSPQEILSASRLSLPPAEVPAVNLGDRARLGALAPGAVPVDNALPAGAALPPDVSLPRRDVTFTRIAKSADKQSVLRPSTRPSTQPASRADKWDPLSLSPSAGTWTYDVTTGRWIHVLPPG